MSTVPNLKKFSFDRKMISKLQNDFSKKIGKADLNDDCPWSASGSCTTNCCGQCNH